MHEVEEEVLPVNNLQEYDDDEKPEVGSLAARVKARSEEIERTISEIFPIPAWEDILAVELRLVGWESLRRVVTKHERQRVEAMKELYTAADQLLLGTSGFYEVLPDTQEGENRYRSAGDHSWTSLARDTGKALPDSLTPRQALIALIGDTNVLVLWKDWQDWMSSRRGGVDTEVARDFGTTQ